MSVALKDVLGPHLLTLFLLLVTIAHHVLSTMTSGPHRPKVIGPRDHELSPLKPCAKIHFRLFDSFISDIWQSNGSWLTWSAFKTSDIFCFQECSQNPLQAAEETSVNIHEKMRGHRAPLRSQLLGMQTARAQRGLLLMTARRSSSNTEHALASTAVSPLLEAGPSESQSRDPLTNSSAWVFLPKA